MPNGIIKMLYSGKEDQQFTKNPDINFLNQFINLIVILLKFLKIYK